ncbi:MAG: hypothetical protein ACI8YQ_001253 [Polaribacter sp.]
MGEHQVLGRQIPRADLLEKRQCTCGVEPLKNCDFWKEIELELTNNHKLSLGKLDLDADDDLVFQQHNHAFFKAIEKISEQNIIVDSSKNWNRLERLQQAGFEVTPIRLQRSIYGVVNSAIKYQKNWWQQTFNYWYYYQKLFETAGNNFPNLQYEALVSEPEAQLSQLMEALSLSFEADQLNWATADSHYIGGNPMRYQKESSLKIDYAWKRELSWFKKAVIGGFALISKLPNSLQFGLYKGISALKFIFKFGR